MKSMLIVADKEKPMSVSKGLLEDDIEIRGYNIFGEKFILKCSYGDLMSLLLKHGNDSENA